MLACYNLAVSYPLLVVCSRHQQLITESRIINMLTKAVTDCKVSVVLLLL